MKLFTNKYIIFSIVVLFQCSNAFCALTCNSAIDALASKDKIKYELQKTLNNCMAQPESERDTCIKTGFETSANNGDYVAAEVLASKSCSEGNAADAQKWLLMVINNPNTPQEDKDIITKILNN